jgi:hypothetical protein
MDFLAQQFIAAVKRIRDEIAKIIANLSSFGSDLKGIKTTTQSIERTTKAYQETKDAAPKITAFLNLPGPIETKRDDYDERQQRRDRWRLLIEVLTLVSVTGYGYMAIRQWREMVSARHQAQSAFVLNERTALASIKEAEKQLNLSRRLANAEKGARYAPCWVELSEPKPNEVHYALSMSNVGKGEAVNIRMFRDAKLLIAEPPDTPDPKDKAIRINDVALARPNKKVHCPAYQYGDLPSTTEYKRGRSRLYVYGTIWWDDLSGEQGQQFCTYFPRQGSVCPNNPKSTYCSCTGHQAHNYEQ